MSKDNILLVMPIHNEEQILRKSVLEVVNDSEKYPFSKILLIENGSRDRSFEISKELEKEFPGKIFAYKEENKGIGHAYHRGVQEALKIAQDSEWIVLSAADMPFENTDINYFNSNKVYDKYCYAIGSKAHEDSVTNYPFKRKLMSKAFCLLRYIFLGMKTEDCQGTIFIKAKEARPLVDIIKSRNFFYSTELTYLIEAKGLKVKEMPIVLKPEMRPSTVNPLKDGLTMLKQTLQISKNYGRI